MDFHGEIAEAVFLTRYADGSEIVTNYSDRPFTHRRRTIGPKDYRLFKPGFFKRIARALSIG